MKGLIEQKLKYKKRKLDEIVDSEYILQTIQTGGLTSYPFDAISFGENGFAALFNEYGNIVGTIQSQLRNDKNFVMELMKIDGCYIWFASERLQNDKEIIKVAIKSNSYDMDSFKEQFKCDIELQLLAAKQWDVRKIGLDSLKNTIFHWLI